MIDASKKVLQPVMELVSVQATMRPPRGLANWSQRLELQMASRQSQLMRLVVVRLLMGQATPKAASPARLFQEPP